VLAAGSTCGPRSLSRSTARAGSNSSMRHTRQAARRTAPDTFLGAGLQSSRRLLESGGIGAPLTALNPHAEPRAGSWHPNPDFLFQDGAGRCSTSARTTSRRLLHSSVRYPGDCGRSKAKPIRRSGRGRARARPSRSSSDARERAVRVSRPARPPRASSASIRSSAARSSRSRGWTARSSFPTRTPRRRLLVWGEATNHISTTKGTTTSPEPGRRNSPRHPCGSTRARLGEQAFHVLDVMCRPSSPRTAASRSRFTAPSRRAPAR